MLQGLNQPYVFVGGATVSLRSTQKALAESIRPTDDVDVVIEVASYADHSLMEERLRKLGIVNDIESGTICRYRAQGIIVDIMLITSDALGFSNRWYLDGFQHAIPCKLLKRPPL